MTVSPELLAASPSISPPLGSELARDLERVETTVWREILCLATREESADAGLLVTAGERFTALGARGIDILYFNRVIGLGTTGDATPADVDLIIERYRAAGVGRFFVHLAPSTRPSALARWLAERGFVHHNNHAKLYRDTRAASEIRTELTVEPIGPERAETFGRLAAPAFDWPPLLARLLARTVGAPGWHHYLAYQGRDAVACAALRVVGRYAYLGPAATLPQHRGRGAQSALIARRIRDAAAAGCTWLVTETAEDRPGRPAPSFRNLRRAGFRLAYLRPNYRWSGEEAVDPPSAQPGA